MWLLILRNLRYRRSAFVFVFIAMTVTAAIVSACAVLAVTGARAAVPPHRLAGAPVVVLGDQSFVPPGADRDNSVWLPEKVRLPSSAVANLRAVPGVTEVVEDIAFPVMTAGVVALGQDWAVAGLAPYRLRAGAAPALPGQVVLDTGLAARTGTEIGDHAEIEVHGVSERYTVVGLAEAASGRPAARSAIFFSAPEIRRLSGHPATVDAFAVLPVPGVSAADLERRTVAALRGTRAVTLTGDERGLAEFPRGREDVSDLTVVFAALGVMALMAALLVVAGVVGSMAVCRRRELLIMRSMGMPRARIRLVMLGEVAVLSVGATLTGSLAGPYLAHWLFERMAAAGVVPAPLVFDPAPAALWTAVLSCLASGLIGAYIPAHLAARTRREEDATGRWPLMAKICLVGAGSLSVAAALLVRVPHVGIAGLAVVVLALVGALTIGRLTGMIGRALAGPVRALSVRTGHLALLNMRGGRTGMIALPIMLSTCLATTNFFLQSGETDAAARAFDGHLRADVVLASATGGVAPAALDRVASLPGVTAAGLVTSRVYLAGDSLQSEEGWPAHGATEFSGMAAFPVSAGSLAELRDRGVALGAEQARRVGAALGDSITVWLGDGTPVRLRVVALLALDRGAEFLLLPAALLAAHTTAASPSHILIRDGSGVVARHVGEKTGLRPVGAADSADHLLRGWVDYLIVALITVFTAIAVAAAQSSATARRGREFGVHRAGGATRAQVMRMLGVEALLVAAIGVVLGTVAGVSVLIPYSLTVNGLPLPPGPAWLYLAVVVSCMSFALVSTLCHAWYTGGREGWLRGRRQGRG